jgi:TatD DNase family protein
MIIDTHSHLQFNAYAGDRDEVIKRTRSANITCINVGTNYATSRAGVEFVQTYGKGFYAAIGLHPLYAAAEFMDIKNDPNETEILEVEKKFDVKKYTALAKEKNVVAIGEIGLDYYYKPKIATNLAEFKKTQKQVFIQQLDLAKELHLPVILHCRMAHDDVIEILQSYALQGVVHCFTGTLEQAQQYIALGFHLGMNGIMFKFNIDEVIKTVPMENLLLETDCPYLTPPQENGKRNEPIFVQHAIQKIAELKGLTPQAVADATTRNAQKLFGI